MVIRVAISTSINVAKSGENVIGPFWTLGALEPLCGFFVH
jgi:hypothetical protein